MKKNQRFFRVIVIGAWMFIFLAALVAWWQSGIPLDALPDFLRETLTGIGIGPAAIVYILLYTIRPLIFFPATLMTVVSGVLFGPWFGILFTFIGENLSANFAFTVARFLGRDIVSTHEGSFARKWDHRLCENGFATVLLMRLLYLPFDAVNYGCGLTSMRQRDFALGTAVGIIPGLITFVLLGGTASVHAIGATRILGFEISGRVIILGLSIVFFILGLFVARVLKKYNKQAQCIIH